MTMSTSAPCSTALRSPSKRLVALRRGSSNIITFADCETERTPRPAGQRRPKRENTRAWALLAALALLWAFYLGRSSGAADAAGARLRIRPKVGKTFGADVYGFDARTMVDDTAAMGRIRQALREHLVLVFHDVAEDLTPARHLAMARGLGPVDAAMSGPPKYVFDGVFNSPDQVDKARAAGMDAAQLGESMRRAAQGSRLPREITRIVKNPADAVAFGEGWHSDLTFHARTPFAAVLVSRQLPEVGRGNTEFADMRAAFRSLAPETRRTLEGLRGNHSDGSGAWAEHAAVRRDPAGQGSLFVNKAFTRSLATAQGEPVPRALLEGLLEHVEAMPREQPEATLDVEWNSGQAVVWDNRFTQHAAHGDYRTRREMHRVIVSDAEAQL